MTLFMYWSLKSIPELAPLSDEKRREIVHECHKGNWARNRYWELLYLLWLAVPPPLIMTFREWPIWFRIPLGVIWSWGWTLFMVQRRISRLVPEIRKRVGGYCISCGYDIRATPRKCPECGLTVPGDHPAA